jgi:hypothetical protein
MTLNSKINESVAAATAATIEAANVFAQQAAAVSKDIQDTTKKVEGMLAQIGNINSGYNAQISAIQAAQAAQIKGIKEAAQKLLDDAYDRNGVERISVESVLGTADAKVLTPALEGVGTVVGHAKKGLFHITDKIMGKANAICPPRKDSK